MGCGQARRFAVCAERRRSRRRWLRTTQKLRSGRAPPPSRHWRRRPSTRDDPKTTMRGERDWLEKGKKVKADARRDLAYALCFAASPLSFFRGLFCLLTWGRLLVHHGGARSAHRPRRGARDAPEPRARLRLFSDPPFRPRTAPPSALATLFPPRSRRKDF